MTSSNNKDDRQAEPDAPPAAADAPASDRIQVDDQAVHLAFQQQLADMLARADVTEEQRQQILIAATCPCCGAGGLSLSLTIKSDKPPEF